MQISNGSRRLEPPPGPEAGVLAQTVAFHRDPLEFLRRRQEEFGDVFQIRLLTARPTFVVTEPEAVEQLLGSDPERAHAGEARRAVLPFASNRSVFGGDADAHRSARARIAAAFAPEVIDSRREAIAAIAERHASKWPLGRPFRLLSRLRTLCDEIFVRLVLGVREEEIARDLIEAIGRMLRTPGNPPVTLPGKGDGLMGELGQALFEQRQTPVVAALYRAVEARRGELAVNANDDEVDVLGCMVTADAELTTEQIVDELMSLLMAAQEPPSIALTWILDRLAREPELAAAFVADPRSQRSDAIVREVLRLRPPASGSLRRLQEPMLVEGRELPAGATVLLPTSLVHRDPRGFRDPARFEPERWLADIIPSWPFFPFGGGARRCVGEPLAHAEIETVVPAILRTLQLTPLAEEPERMVQRATVLVPQRSLLVRASRA
ncbi:MAG TPA: cytochrome P450 [Solirubrobacterales bacterium]|jgi:cytochrome P450|nr:cytochrome P450 [Solirubrobacterales bacterium]